MSSEEIQAAEKAIHEVEGRLNMHEAVCAERYSGINARLKRLEGILIASGGAIILLLLSLVLKTK